MAKARGSDVVSVESTGGSNGIPKVDSAMRSGGLQWDTKGGPLGREVGSKGWEHKGEPAGTRSKCYLPDVDECGVFSLSPAVLTSLREARLGGAMRTSAKSSEAAPPYGRSQKVSRDSNMNLLTCMEGRCMQIYSYIHTHQSRPIKLYVSILDF